MKSSLIIASLFATLTLSKPLHERLHDKRRYEYVEEVVTVTQTVSGSGWSWGGWGSWNTASSTSTDAPPPAVVTETPLSTAAAPVVMTTVTMGGSPAAPTTTTPAAPASSAPVFSESASSATSAAAAVDTSAPDSYSQAILDQHNNHRVGNHSVPALSWSADMASIAAEIAASCVYAHNTAAGGGGYGQNIGAGAPPEDIPAMITNEMYNGEINFYPTPYGLANPDMSDFEQWGHYSQIVWKDTTAVGCATQYCPGGLANVGSGVSPYFTVCNYSPPGNFGGEYGANVLQPEGEPTITV